MTTEVKLRTPADIEETTPIQTDTSITPQPTAIKPPQTIQLTKRLQVTDPEGRVTYDTGETPSYSFVVAFIRGLWACFTRTSLTAVDIDGVWHRLVSWGATDTQMFRLNAPTTETRFGPVVGMGTRALSNFDTRLDTQISHGDGSNQLVYGETTLLEPAEVTGALVITIHRVYANHSPADVIVSECGLYSANNQWSPPRFHCIIRDLVTPAISVPVGHSLLLEYRILTRA